MALLQERNSKVAVVTAPTLRFYKPELDCVRFIAFLFVFLYHSIPDGGDPRIKFMSQGWLAIIDSINKAFSFGLILFFILSAFLISELLLRERESAGTIKIGQFYVRRVLRIWPLYFFTLLLGVMVGMLPGERHLAISDATWFLLFLGAQRVAWYGPLASPINPLWSISVEEQFYLIVPMSIKKIRARWLIVCCLAVILFADSWLGYLAATTRSDLRLWFDSFVQFQSFAVGIMLCVLVRRTAIALSNLQRSIVFLTAMLTWLTATLFCQVRFHGLSYPGTWRVVCGYTLAQIGGALIIVSFLGIRAAAIPHWVIYLGRISFGLYIFHEFARDFVNRFLLGHRLTTGIASHVVRIVAAGSIDIVVSLALTIILASLSYRFIEGPFLKMKARFSTVESTPPPQLKSSQSEV